MSKNTNGWDQIGRITEYEKMLDEATALLEEKKDINRLAVLADRLETYYTGHLWKQDYADDEAGRLPADLKRGVLSQDGIYDLLTAFEEYQKETALETERLILRTWKVSDAEECFRYAKDPQVGPIAGWPPHKSVEESRNVITRYLIVPETYAIVLKQTGLPIGCISLKFHSDLAEAEDEAELGYWLGVPYWGQGIVPEAASELLRHAFEDLGLSRVWCGYYEGNLRSGRVQEKLGFRFVRRTENAPVPQMGETRVGYVNLLTKEEWQENNRCGGTG